MIGLLIFLLVGAYLLISVAIVFWSQRLAKKRGRSRWIWGSAAAMGMYLLVFWDLIPVLVMHRYYCSNDGGIWVYETPEHWASKNPEALRQNLVHPRSLAQRTEQLPSGWRTWLSDSLYSESNFDRRFSHAIRREEQRLIDARTGQVLAGEVDYERGNVRAIELGGESLTDLKIWLGMGNNTCGTSQAEYHKKYASIAKDFEALFSGQDSR